MRIPICFSSVSIIGHKSDFQAVRDVFYAKNPFEHLLPLEGRDVLDAWGARFRRCEVNEERFIESGRFSMHVSLETDWSIPEGFFGALAAKYPSLEIDAGCVEECDEFCIDLSYASGVLVSREEDVLEDEEFLES